MRDNITAQWAKEKASTILSDKINGQINSALNDIEMAVKNNRFSTNISTDLHDLAIADLRGRGFEVKRKVSNYDGYGSITSHDISWE